MSNANIMERKLELIQWLSVIEDTSLLDKIANLKESDSHDWWDDISDSEKELVDIGIEQADAGDVKPHSEVRKLYGRFL